MRISSVPLIFFGSFFLTLLIYFPTADAKCTFDFLDFIGSYHKNGWNIWYAETHHISPYIVSKVVVTSLYLLFGFSGFKWHLVSCALVALDAALLFVLLRNLLQKRNAEIAETSAAIGTFVFLLVPYHTEAIVWVGAFNYLLVGSFVLAGLYSITRYVENVSIRWLALSAISLLLATFTHEWGLFGILAALLIYGFLLPKPKIISVSTVLLGSAYVAVIGMYLFNQWLSGEWISHYGADVHLHFQWREMTAMFFKYILKIVFLSGFWQTHIQSKVYDWLLLPLPNTFLCMVLLSAIFFSIYKVFLRPGRTSVICLLFLLFALFVFPVLNLYFPYWTKIMADRYCYLTAPFLLSAIVVGLFMSGNYLRWLLMPYTLLSAYMLAQNIINWNYAGKITAALENNFKGYGSSRVFFLNMPDNFHGAYMMRSGFGSGMTARCVKQMNNTPCTEQLHDVVSYNLCSPIDSAIVQIKDSATLYVKLSNPGSWCWYYGGGGRSYENDVFKVELEKNTNGYSVNFKNKKTDDVFLYQAGSSWHRVNNFK